MVLYFTTRKVDGKSVNTWALAGASPGTAANWQEVTNQTEANGFSALVGASALVRTPEQFDALKAQFLGPLSIVVATNA